MNQAKMLLILHIIIIIYSISGVCSKIASQYHFFSLQFYLFYGFSIILLGVYAILWQKIIKKIPLSVAFSNKAVTIIWGGIFGALFFNEIITLGKIIGAIIVVIGIILYSQY